MFNDNVPFIGRDDAGDRTAAAPANDLTLSGRAKICVIPSYKGYVVVENKF